MRHVDSSARYDIRYIMDHTEVKSAASGFADARKRRTRAALRSAMLDLLTRKSFEQIQILDLTGAAKVGYATFFRHYASTVAVLEEIATDEIRALLAMTIPVFQHTDSVATVRALCQYVFARRLLWRTLLTGGAAHSVRAEFVRQARVWSRDMVGKTTRVPQDLGTACAAGATLDALAWWLEGDLSHTVDEMAGFIDRLIITPFVGESGHE